LRATGRWKAEGIELRATVGGQWEREWRIRAEEAGERGAGAHVTQGREAEVSS
jgi:hypothetical protein